MRSKEIKDTIDEITGTNSFQAIKVIGAITIVLVIAGGLFQVLGFTAKSYMDMNDQFKRK